MKPDFSQVMTWFFLGELAALGAFFYLLPGLTRHDLFFAITVPQDFRKTPEGRTILRPYHHAVWIHSLIAAGLVLAGVARNNFLLLLSGIYWQLVGMLVAFLRGRKHTQPYAVHPSMQREAALAPRASGLLGNWPLQLGPFVILTAAAIFISRRWNSLPVRFPVHWGITGQPDRWATRDFLGVYGAMLTAFVLCAMLALLSYAMVHWSRQIRAGGEAATNEARFRQVQIGILLSTEYLIALLFSWLSLLPLRSNPTMTPVATSLIFLGVLAYVVTIIWLLKHTGQGGVELAGGGAGAEIPSGAPPIGDRTPDECWKAGMVYVNRDDPAILVEKRFGIGYTLNFGNPRSWLVLGAILIPLIAVSLIAGSQ